MEKFTAVPQGFGVRSRCITCRWRGLTARLRLPDRCLPAGESPQDWPAWPIWPRPKASRRRPHPGRPIQLLPFRPDPAPAPPTLLTLLAPSARPRPSLPQTPPLSTGPRPPSSPAPPFSPTGPAHCVHQPRLSLPQAPPLSAGPAPFSAYLVAPRPCRWARAATLLRTVRRLARTCREGGGQRWKGTVGSASLAHGRRGAVGTYLGKGRHNHVFSLSAGRRDIRKGGQEEPSRTFPSSSFHPHHALISAPPPLMTPPLGVLLVSGLPHSTLL